MSQVQWASVSLLYSQAFFCSYVFAWELAKFCSCRVEAEKAECQLSNSYWGYFLLNFIAKFFF